MQQFILMKSYCKHILAEGNSTIENELQLEFLW